MSNLLDAVKKYNMIVAPFYKNGSVVWLADTTKKSDLPGVVFRSNSVRSAGHTIDAEGFDLYSSPEEAIEAAIKKIEG